MAEVILSTLTLYDSAEKLVGYDHECEGSSFLLYSEALNFHRPS